MRKLLWIFAHTAFWVTTLYMVTRLYGIETIEVFETEDELIETITYDQQFVRATLVTGLFSLMIFYGNIFVLLERYFRDRRALAYLFNISAFFLAGFLLATLVNRFLVYQLSPQAGLFVFPSFELQMSLFFFYLALSYAYAFTRAWFKNEKLKNRLLQEKLETELSFLKSQINPHFLFNTLNNLYSIAQKHGVEELSVGLEELSSLMRYMLYESNEQQVALSKEVAYLESYIKIQHLRYDEEDELVIHFEKKGDLDRQRLAPMILIPFVENAFKHGVSFEGCSLIRLTLEARENSIYFKIDNKIYEERHFEDDSSGIGLENVQRRLELIYPARHQLDIRCENNHYIVELFIWDEH